jgi:hypothetical protein
MATKKVTSTEPKEKKKRVAKPKVWVPKVMDLTLTLESIGAKMGDKVMLGSGPHEIVGFDASKSEQVQLKSLIPNTTGTVRRNLATVQNLLIKE